MRVHCEVHPSAPGACRRRHPPRRWRRRIHPRRTIRRTGTTKQVHGNIHRACQDKGKQTAAQVQTETVPVGFALVRAYVAPGTGCARAESTVAGREDRASSCMGHGGSDRDATHTHTQLGLPAGRGHGHRHVKIGSGCHFARLPSNSAHVSREHCTQASR